jgi:hypothetical protein
MPRARSALAAPSADTVRRIRGERGIAMSWIVDKIKWIMVVSGALTCTMIYAAIAPQAALQSTFGETLQGPLVEIVVRNWGVLITIVGAMLIYGAYHLPSRPLVLTVAGVSKLVSSCSCCRKAAAISASRRPSRLPSTRCGWSCLARIFWLKAARDVTVTSPPPP